MNFKKYIIPGCIALSMGLGSCVGDLDLKPNDPNLVDQDAADFKDNSLAMCYSGIACSGIKGPGSSYVDGLDAGTSAYLRMLFTLNEFCADEMIWIWPDDGVRDIVSSSWSVDNGLLQGAYYRIVGHITLCNQYLRNTADDTDEVSMENKAQARTLRAFSYYNMLDLFGQSSFITEEAELGEAPKQVSRKWLYEWLVEELKDIVDNRRINETPLYGRVGLDGAEALLAKLYLNAEVFSGTAAWQECAQRCQNIIARHEGKGPLGSGLAENYLYLFSRDNNAYMPGGAFSDQNEILFGIAYDATYTQSYGGPTFIIAGTCSNTHYIPRELYGCQDEWSCIRGRYEMSQRFDPNDGDTRDDLWIRGEQPAGQLYAYTEQNGVKTLDLDDKGKPVIAFTIDGEGKKKNIEWEAEDYSDRFAGFTGAWATTGGNAILKFTGATRRPGGVDPTATDALQKYFDMNLDTPAQFINFNGKDYQITNDVWKVNFPSTSFATTDQPIIRLADIYLMYAECYLNGAGDGSTAVKYVNYVRNRAGASSWGLGNLTIQSLMDERSRELYLESVRRTDLVRNKMFAGPSQTVWQYKGSMESNEGTRIAEKYNLYPIPYAVRAAQPEFQQNPGY